MVPKKLAEVDNLQMIGYMKMNGVEGCQNTKFLLKCSRPKWDVERPSID